MQKRVKGLASAAIVALGGASAAATAAPAAAAVLFFGGHYYEYISALDIGWTAARDAAGALVFDGQTGYLATITSAAENEFLRSNFSLGAVGFAGAWLGGQVTPDSGGAKGFWVTGPETGQQFSLGGAGFGGAYANWGGVEPNNAPSYAYMNVGSAFAGIANGQWADAINGVSSVNDPIKGYIVEYNGGPNAAPEPAAWALMLVGFCAAGALLRRRRPARTAPA
jgi:hypothetical protein